MPPTSLLGSARGLYRSPDGRYLLAGTPECIARCCGVGFYRAFPCQPGVGCGGGVEGVPIWVPRNYVCAPDGSPPGGRTVIGFDRACWTVDTGVVWRLCPPGAIPSHPNCIPDGGRVIAPGTPVNCYPDCSHPDCLNTLPRWVTLRPCRAGAWPPGTPLPVIRAPDGGCVVGRDGNGDCWRADCADVFAAREEDVADRIFATELDLSYRTCCECQCQGGQTAWLGCDESYPPPGRQPVTCCCPPELNPGVVLHLEATRVTVESGRYANRVTETIDGTWTLGPGQVVTGSGTRTVRTEYIGPPCPPFDACPPGVPCDDTQVFVYPAPPLPWCPAPMWESRPCPWEPPPRGGPGFSWDGVRNCRGSFTRSRWTNPTPPTCSQSGLAASIVSEGRVTVTGIDYGPCTGGCGERTPFGLAGMSERPSGLMVPTARVVVPHGFGVNEPTGCAGCGGRGL